MISSRSRRLAERPWPEKFRKWVKAIEQVFDTISTSPVWVKMSAAAGWQTKVEGLAGWYLPSTQVTTGVRWETNPGSQCSRHWSAKNKIINVALTWPQTWWNLVSIWVSVSKILQSFYCFGFGIKSFIATCLCSDQTTIGPIRPNDPHSLNFCWRLSFHDHASAPFYRCLRTNLLKFCKACMCYVYVQTSV